MSKLIALDGMTPRLGSRAFVADGAVLVGDVEVGDDSSVFYNAVLRGDLAPIRIGKRTNIQDNVTVHVSTGVPTVIGDEVTVGHNAVLHACTIDDNVMVGMGAIVMDGAHIKKNCIVGAGAIVTQGKEFPENSLVLGAPAHVVRELTTEEIEGVRGGVDRYVEIKDKLLEA
ncbi:gamma carbonic anhydrase family protein [Fibrobacter sp. UWR2]|jgi:carbonic anhydrase/acetyltransferase-like protein (isoleucine patch superfamily)|uniref:gamma carbonic anhydrase family protein n=1 Tax=Fibrobacter sp. UWR2 TaxID=1964352 RepID=UPI000B523A39|nr:gamma carbonic anhydrase family protein [Fibrobacter sp. UWR2]MBR4348356.1 gamma carbonic anhydrase family protein [Fibrobacter sp.]OWV00387.1 gamma carbonic anhydrase family protein [Fibrobacter sp. UWR2]